MKFPTQNNMRPPTKTQILKELKQIAFFITFVIFILLIIVIDWGFLKSEIIKYPISYYPEFGWTTLNKTTYKVSVKRQDVVGRMADFAPNRYTDCAVVNRKNWSCTYDDGSGSFGFNRGHFWDNDEKNDDWKFVSRPVYLYYRWRDIFRK
jgi:hypothetical protein